MQQRAWVVISHPLSNSLKSSLTKAKKLLRASFSILESSKLDGKPRGVILNINDLFDYQHINSRVPLGIPRAKEASLHIRVEQFECSI